MSCIPSRAGSGIHIVEVSCFKTRRISSKDFILPTKSKTNALTLLFYLATKPRVTFCLTNYTALLYVPVNQLHSSRRVLPVSARFLQNGTDKVSTRSGSLSGALIKAQLPGYFGKPFDLKSTSKKQRICKYFEPENCDSIQIGNKNLMRGAA